MSQTSFNGSTPQSSTGSGRDFIAELDSVKHEEEWAWTIIGAMARIQTQYALERNIDKNLPKDYFTDADKLKFFWSGLTNSSSVKTVFDLIIRSIINWEVLFLIIVMVFAQIFVYSAFAEKNMIDLIIFGCSYFSIVGYSLYIALRFRYFVYGDLSAKMMLYLILGRILFLIISALILSSVIFYIVEYFYNAPKDLYRICSGLYWVFNILDIAREWLGTKEQFILIVEKLVLPELKNTAKEMLYVFLFFGLFPLVLMFFGKIVRTIRISYERRKYNRGE